MQTSNIFESISASSLMSYITALAGVATAVGVIAHFFDRLISAIGRKFLGTTLEQFMDTNCRQPQEEILRRFDLLEASVNKGLMETKMFQQLDVGAETRFHRTHGEFKDLGFECNTVDEIAKQKGWL